MVEEAEDTAVAFVVEEVSVPEDMDHMDLSSVEGSLVEDRNSGMLVDRPSSRVAAEYLRIVRHTLTSLEGGTLKHVMFVSETTFPTPFKSQQAERSGIRPCGRNGIAGIVCPRYRCPVQGVAPVNKCFEQASSQGITSSSQQ